MVLTRSQVRVLDNSLENSIHEHASRAAARRFVNPQQSPSKAAKKRQQQQDKRNSEKYQKLLTTVKRNLSKASERNLPEPPVQPETLFEIIHAPIVSGEAKRNLRPVTIEIEKFYLSFYDIQ